jgi:predicted secreted protein
MNIGGAIVIFVIIWWSVFFAVLPWGVRGRWEEADDGVKGAEPGAPVKPDLLRKALITTGIAAVLWAITVAIILSGIINYRD